MKIVQSYWSKPSNKQANLHPNDRNLGGWQAKRYNYMSWMLSSMQLSQLYDEIELVTDEQGYDLLVNKLQLPYTNVRVELDRLNEYHSDLWALGKIYAYSIQKTPFIHVDGDVFIWDRFPTAFESADLIAQNVEVDEPGYADVNHHVLQYFDFIPDVLPTQEKEITSVNAGIFGGADIAFFEEYTALAFEFVNRNMDKIQGLNIGAFNMYYEQYLFYCLAQEKQKLIHFLIDDQRQLVDKHVNFSGVPANSTYLHTVGTFKKRRETGNLLEHTFLSTYPDHYYHLLGLLLHHEV